MTTGLCSEKRSPLSPEAVELYNKELDSFGTARSWFIGLWDLYRLANRLAGGPGEAPGKIHYLFRQIVCQGEEAMPLVEGIAASARENVERVGALESVYLRCVINGEDPASVLAGSLLRAEAKVNQQEEMSPREKLAYDVLCRGENLEKVIEELGVVRETVEARAQNNKERLNSAEAFALRVAGGESPQDVFNDLGVTRDAVESRFLCRSLTAEELDFVVHPDGKPEACPGCLKNQQFQPVVAKCIDRNLADVDSSALSEEYFAGDENGTWTMGSFLVVKDNSGHFEAKGYHGPVLKVEGFKGLNHLLLARERLAEVLKKQGLVLSFGRDHAEKMAAQNTSRAQARRDEHDRVVGSIGSSRSGHSGLSGGLGIPDHRRSNKKGSRKDGRQWR